MTTSPHQCAPWPHETVGWGHNALANTSSQLIRTHVAELLAESHNSIAPPALEQMFANNRTQRACMLLRASNGRLLIDLLDTPWLGHGNIDVGSCHASKIENYIRSRMHVAFRLILRAIRRLRPPDFEVAFCPDDCPPSLNAKPGVRPALTTISCHQHRSLPFVAWITQPGQRATDLSDWDNAMQTEWQPITAWAQRQSKAVFRGGLRNYSYCGGQPSDQPRYREWITPSNWRTTGRAAIWAARVAHPEQLDVNFGNHEEMAARWNLSAAEAAARDEPRSVLMQEQARKYRYVVHPEGACSSSDRLKQSFASPMLLLKQAAPCYEWFEPFFLPGQHFVPVDGNFVNLSAAIAWAQGHDAEAQQMVAAANERAKEVVSVAALYEYSEALLKGYATRYSRALANKDSAWLQRRRAKGFRHEFSCHYTTNYTKCAMRLLSTV